MLRLGGGAADLALGIAGAVQRDGPRDLLPAELGAERLHLVGIARDLRLEVLEMAGDARGGGRRY
ncbi:MAG: hypothetical protein WCZ28_06120 [Burkholderiaceae bacterium]